MMMMMMCVLGTILDFTLTNDYRESIVPSLYSHSQRGWQSFPRKAVIRELKRSNKMTCVAFFVCGEPGAGWTISQPN